MAYLLIIAISVYIALATLVLQRQPHSAAHRLLAATALAAALVTAGYLVLGTTADRTAAQIAALLVVISGSLTVMTLLPLFLLALYDDSWYAAHRRPLLDWALRGQVTLVLAALALIEVRALPLVVRVNGDYWQHGVLLEAHMHWTRAAVLVLLSLIPSAAAIGFAVQRRWIALWRGALPLTLLTTSAALLPAIAPLAGGSGAVVVAALGLAPLVIVGAGLVLRQSPLTALDTLIESSLHRYNEGLVVLDAWGRVVWHNAQAGQWFAPRARRVMPQPIDNLLHDTLLLAPVHHLLTGEDTRTSCEWVEGGTEIALKLELHPLDQVRHLPRARLLVIRPVPSTHMLLTQQAQRAELLVLSAISADIASSLDLDQVITRALQQTQVVVNADSAVIYLLDSYDHTRLARAGQIIREGEERHALDAPLSLPVADSTAGWVIANAKSVFTSGVEQDGEQDTLLAQRGLRAGATVPLLARNRVIGVLHVGMRAPRHFDPVAVALVESVGRQLGIAIDNARLHHEERRQRRVAEVLSNVAGILTTLDLDRALHSLLDQLQDLIAYTRASILLLDKPGTLGISAHVGFEDVPDDGSLNDVRIHIGDYPYLQAVFEQRLPQLVTDTATDPRWTPGDFQFGSWIGVPLIIHDQVLGCLTVAHRQARRFDQTDLQLAATFADQAVIAVENAMLFEATTQRATLSTDLNRLSLAISAQLDRDTVLRLLCDESLGIFDVQGAYIWLVDDAYLIGVAASGVGADQFQGHSIALKDKHLLPAQVLDRWQPQIVQHIAPGSTVLTAEFLAWTQARSALAIPLLKADVPIGVLMLVNTRSAEAFSNWPLDQIGVLGVQAALAIQNALLYQEAQQRLDQLRLVNETTRYATAILSPIPLIEGVTQKIVRTLNYDLVSLIEVDVPDSLTVQTVYFRDEALSDEAIAPLADTLLAHAEDAAHVAVPIQQNVYYSLLDAPDTGDGAPASNFCALAVPMIIADEVTGVLLVARQDVDSITHADMDVLQPLAAQLAISISNARLYEKVRQQTVALEARVAARTAEIRRQHERTEAILRSVADAVIVFDMQAKVVMTNPAARALFDQFDLSMDLGTRVRALVAPILSGDHHGHDPTEIFEAGASTLQAKAAPVVDDETTLGAVVIIRDITRLSELDRMKDMFVSNVSHELRTPMANLKLYLSLLEQGRPERRDKYREVMKREVERLERLISDLLQISRLKSEQRAEHTQTRQPFDLEALINAVIEGNVAVAQAEHKQLHHECASSPLPLCHGDPDQIIRALTNLVSNALRYTPEGGSITVRSFARGPVPGQAELESVIIEVIDTGIGIPKQELTAIFERFYRGSNISPTISGTGLGLAIVKEIVDLHAGQLEVESDVGRGSTFRMTLPVIP